MSNKASWRISSHFDILENSNVPFLRNEFLENSKDFFTIRKFIRNEDPFYDLEHPVFKIEHVYVSDSNFRILLY